MKKVSCEVIRDLLPLYEDGAASQEAQDMVREHLKDCPACREELRKMRTPLSLPLEQDEEMWKRYAEKRAKLQRKRRKKIAIAAAVLAVIVLACLWYTRPQSWKGLTNAAPEEVTSLSGSLSVYYFHVDDKGSIDHGWDIWLMQADQAGGAATQAVMEALQSYSYRKSMKNLISRDSWNLRGGTNSVKAGLVLSNSDFITFDIYNNGWMFIDGELYNTDGELYDQLAPILQAYGTFQE